MSAIFEDITDAVGFTPLVQLNKLGAEGWEAISGTYAVGETKKVVLGQGMAPSLAVGAPMWVAVMKRAIKPAGAD